MTWHAVATSGVLGGGEPEGRSFSPLVSVTRRGRRARERRPCGSNVEAERARVTRLTEWLRGIRRREAALAVI